MRDVTVSCRVYLALLALCLATDSGDSCCALSNRGCINCLCSPLRHPRLLRELFMTGRRSLSLPQGQFMLIANADGAGECKSGAQLCAVPDSLLVPSHPASSHTQTLTSYHRLSPAILLTRFTSLYSSLPATGPFSRVDVLLEAANSPHAPSPAKQSKTKKTSKSEGNPSTLSGNSNSSAMSSGTANPPGRKSAYQGPKISMACFSCRSSKTRCSGTQPCNRCDLKRMDCHYPLRDGRTANRTSLQTLSTVSSMTPSSQSGTPVPPPLPHILPHNHSVYEPGPMQRFNQVFAYSNSSSPVGYRNANSASSATPSVFGHQVPVPQLSSSSSTRPLLHTSLSAAQHHFPKPPPSQSPRLQQGSQQQRSPSTQDAESPAYRPSSGGSTTSRTHTHLPLNSTANAKRTASKSPEQFHYFPSIERTDRLSASHPAGAGRKNDRPMTTGGQYGYAKPANVKEEERYNGEGGGGRDRSHSFPHPVPSHLRDYVPGLLPPPIPSSSLSPLLGPQRNGEGHDPERFQEGSLKMRDSNALQLKDHRRPANAHPEASAFSESEPVYKPETHEQHQGLPYPSSSAYLPFSFGASQHRFSPHPPTISPHHIRHNGYVPQNAGPSVNGPAAKAVVKQESEEASPEMDELSESPAAFEKSDLTDAASDMERSSRTSPPSTAGTSLSMSLQSASMPGSKADTPNSLHNVVGPAYLHRHNALPSILGMKGLPDALLPWRELLGQAGIPDLETLKSEIPFEAVKRYVDCLAESWPDILPTFTKRFQLRYAIEDALMRACSDAPMTAVEQCN
ncbi:hypothetical protein P389DRAFT_107315 [Cystobasidium minutum MCA 4210]|uniref:uncharacterized protein n=1 Tax=Cystobasidium minutum MCA 4210 TaxID=1397322 RepID=UPI0034CED28F|eukprot:jgi/Rhomi1/107315/CE107314_3149